MLLAVDVGNTQTVLGLFEGNRLVWHKRIATNQTATPDELAIKLNGLFLLSDIEVLAVDNLALASVVPNLTESWRELAAMLQVPAIVVGPGVKTGIPLKYDNPAEIGADRIADAVAAIERYGAPVVVVDLGTATNIEVIDAQGAFVGGIIAPGLMTSAEALFKAAARLSYVDLQEPAHAIGSNTRMAVQSGLVYGEVARIDGLVQRVFNQLGYAATVIATGGLASRIAPLSATIDTVDEELTLIGLQLIFERNKQSAVNHGR